MYRIRFETLGCKLNQIETESLAHAFREEGFAVMDEDLRLAMDKAGSTVPIDGEDKSPQLPENPVTPAYKALKAAPDLCIVNTCTVTGKAEQKARRLIRGLLKSYPGSIVLVTGCYAEVEEEAIHAIDPRVAVFPGSRKGALADLPRFLATRASDGTTASAAPVGARSENFALQIHEFCRLHAAVSAPATQVRTSATLASAPVPAGATVPAGTPVPAGEPVPADTVIPETFRLSTDDFLFHSRASIKIQDGCDNRCSYCRIRLARGKAVSLDGDEVIARVKKIEDAGWGEVILSGVNLSQYRSGGGDFAGLLERLLAETDRIAIRIGSLYPERVDEAILPALAHGRICPHFHLSVQSGSDRILKAMRRPYAADAVIRATQRLRSIKENPFLACDIITGFPGETDEDFAQTLDLCERAGFAAIHAFPFSPRPGTEAWEMKPRIPERVAGERVARLTALAEKNLRAYGEYWIGRTVSAVAEETPEGKPVTAVTENYLSVTLAADSRLVPRGKRILVTITGAGHAKMA